MTVTRWDPFREVVALQNRVNSLFRDLGEDQDTAPAASFAPAVDIYEDAKKVVLKLEVPGIEEKDLDIRVENHTLTVKGERKFEVEEKEQNFHRIERRYGSFFRAFTQDEVHHACLRHQPYSTVQPPSMTSGRRRRSGLH